MSCSATGGGNSREIYGPSIAWPKQQLQTPSPSQPSFWVPWYPHPTQLWVLGVSTGSSWCWGGCCAMRHGDTVWHGDWWLSRGTHSYTLTPPLGDTVTLSLATHHAPRTPPPHQMPPTGHHQPQQGTGASEPGTQTHVWAGDDQPCCSPGEDGGSQTRLAPWWDHAGKRGEERGEWEGWGGAMLLTALGIAPTGP